MEVEECNPGSWGKCERVGIVSLGILLLLDVYERADKSRSGRHQEHILRSINVNSDQPQARPIVQAYIKQPYSASGIPLH